MFGEVLNIKINPDDYMGACNLGSLMLHNFVVYPFTKHAHINYEKLKYSVHRGVRLLDNIIDINVFPYKAYENYQKNMRTIGLGITGLADLLVMLNMKYGDKESVEFTDELLNFIVKEAYRGSIKLAREKGSFPFLDREKFVKSGFIQKHIKFDSEWQEIADDILRYGIRNARLISIAPTGTMSLTFGENCSSGLEPIFSLEYERIVKIGGQDESNKQKIKMRDYAYDMWLNTKEDNIVKKEKFVTAMDLSVQDHINILKVIAFHTDMSCSKTINIPTEYPFEGVKQVYMDCWKSGIKGVTIFRPNPIRQGIFITEGNANKEEVQPTNALRRGEWEEIADDTQYEKRKIYIGCGKLNLFIGYSKSKKSIQDLYVVRSGNGGCERNLQGMVIAMSGMLRLGGNILNIEKAFQGIGGCNSFIAERIKGEKLSKGSSCGTAILNEIRTFLKEKASEVEVIVETPVLPEEETIVESEDYSIVEEARYLTEHGEIAYANKYHKCPLCKEPLEYAGGCLSCKDCGWSKCS